MSWEIKFLKKNGTIFVKALAFCSKKNFGFIKILSDEENNLDFIIKCSVVLYRLISQLTKGFTSLQSCKKKIDFHALITSILR